MLAPAVQAQQRAFDLPAGEATRTIPEFGRQAGVQISAPTKDLRGVHTQAIKGQMDVQEALRRLLAGTNLELSRSNSSVLVIRKTASSASAPVIGSSTARTSENSASNGQAGSAAAALSQNADASKGEDIVVTGSRLPQFGADGPAPVTTFSEEKIQQLGSSNVADVLNFLPQNSFFFNESFNFGGSRSVQLRGLGTGTTLVLVNGRRTVTSSLQAARNNFDLNQIPISAVERIEVLSNSASAIYGADAIGGVVNIILKKEIKHPVVDLYYGFTPDGDSDEKRASLSFGLSSSRFRSAFTVDYFKRTPLFGRDRDITANADFRRFGSVDRRSNNSNPGNVFSTTAAPLPGLTSTFAAVPAGSTGVGLTPADFRATQGTLNLESLNSFASIIPESERYSGSASLEFDLTDNVTLFGDALYSHTNDRAFRSPNALSNSLVPANNPFNPFGVPVRVRFLLTSLGPQEVHAEDESFRGVLGARGKVANWNWEVAYLRTKDTSRSGIFFNFLDPVKVRAALASTNPATALNPFQDGPGGSPQLLASLLATPTEDPGESGAQQISAVVSGPLFQLPAGPVELVIGGEARKEDILFNVALDTVGTFVNLVADRKTEALFGELRVPIIANVPMFKRLSVTGAARYDHYNDFGGTFNPQVAVEWEVDRALMLRASYGTSFRAPPLFELYSPQIRVPNSTVTDPRRNNEIALATVQTAGNPDLNPEKANSWSAGLVYRPGWLSNTRFSVDYWNIKQKQRVQRFTAADVIRNEAALPGRVVRAAPSPQDTAAGLPGPITFVDATSLNFGSVDTDGLDIRADYSRQTSAGTFSANLAGTYVFNFDAADLPTSPTIERAGRAFTQGSVPEWKVTGTLGWSYEGLLATTTARYTDSYDDATTLNVLNGRRVDSRVLVDAQVAFDFGKGLHNPPGWLNGTVVRVGVNNLFDVAPPFSEISSSGYDQSQADVRQRFVYLKLSKTF